MCNIYVAKEDVYKNLDFIIYNIMMMEKGKFTIDEISKQLEEYEISIEKDQIVASLSKWIEEGLIFDNARDYILANGAY